MICGAGTSSGGGASPGGRLGILRVLSSQSPPPRRASVVWCSVTLLVDRGRRTGSRTCDDRFSSPNATFAEAASERRGPRRVQAVVAQRLPGIHAPVVAVGQKRRPRELSWRSWKRSSTVPLVGRFKGCSRIQARVGQRRFANGLGGIGVIIEIEVAGSVDAGLAVGQVQGQGLALLDVP